MDASLSRLDATPRAALAPPEDRDHPTPQSALNEPSAELRFEDFLDVINPLQHIPIVASIYRAITGDEISGPARIIGGALFGGPIGFVVGIIDAITDEISGKGLGELAVAALIGGDDASQAVAQNTGNSGGAVEAPPLVLAAVQSVPVPVIVAHDAGTRKPPLTGAAALQALTADLRGAHALDVITAAPADPSAVPRGGMAALQDRPIALPSLDEFTLQMLDGLDKYNALATARPRLDHTL